MGTIRKIYEPASGIAYVIFIEHAHGKKLEKAAGNISAIKEYCISNKIKYEHLVESHQHYLSCLEWDYPGRTYKFVKRR